MAQQQQQHRAMYQGFRLNSAKLDRWSKKDEGFNLFKVGLPRRAEPIFTGLTQQMPKDAYNPYMLGCISQKDRDYQTAMKHYEHALQLKPDSVAILTNRAEVLMLIGQLVEARDGFQRVLQMDPERRFPPTRRCVELFECIEKIIAWTNAHPRATPQ